MKNKKKLIIIIVIISIVALLLIGGGTTAIIMSSRNVEEKHTELDINDNQSFSYDGEKQKPTINNLDDIDESKVVYSFKEKDNDPNGGTYITGVPTNAGTYYVKTTYEDTSKIITMTIEKANLTLVDLTCNYNNPNGDYFTSEVDPKSVEFLYTFTDSSNNKLDGTFSLNTDTFTPSVSEYEYTFVPNNSNYSSYQGTIDLDIYATVYVYDGDEIKDYYELPYNSTFEYELNEREGYDKPYLTDKDGNIIGDDYKVLDDVNLYFVENVKNYTITYELDGGVNGDNPQTFTKFDENIDLQSASKLGYTFKGWYLDSNFENGIITIQKGTVGSLTLYAKFELINYTITYNLGAEEYNDSDNITTIRITDTFTLKPATKTGYTFKGWYLYGEKVEVLSNISSNITLTPQFEIGVYTITFDSQGGSEVSSITQEYNTNLVLPTNVEKAGYQLRGWYYDKEGTKVFKLSKMPSESITLYAVYNIVDYTITYNLDGGTNTNPYSYNVESNYTFIDSSKEGFTFTGWYLEDTFENRVYGTSGLTGNLTLYAKFSINAYEVTFITNGGDSVTSIHADYDEVITLPEAVRAGYEFDAWCSDSELENPVPMNYQVKGDITLYAKFTIETYTITYKLDGGVNGANPDSYTIESSTITLLDPSKNGYDFVGWYLEDTFENKVEEITLGSTGNKMLYAKFIPTVYSITYDLDGGVNGANPDSYTIESEAIILKDPTKAGYQFDGWYLEDTFENKITEIESGSTGPKAFYAKFTIITYTITYNLDGGTDGGNPSTYTVEDATITLSDGVKIGYTFLGWYLEDTFETKATEVALGSTGNKVFYAKYTPIVYAITYNLDGGVNGANPDFYTIESDTIVLTNATKTGYTFLGWYSENTFENRVYQIEAGSHEAIELFAKFSIDTYTITYNLDGGVNGLNPDTYTVLTPTIVLDNATKAGYTFLGWYLEDTFENKVEEITLGSIGNQTLYANFVIDTYTITYNLNGGVNGANPDSYTINDLSIALVNATKANYDFAGWYLEDTFDTLVTEITSLGNHVLFAKFTPTVYTITYDLDGGVNGANPSTYTVETPTFSLIAPSKANYDFVGWYLENTYENGVTEVTLGTTGNKTFYAKFIPTVYSITYNLNGGVNGANPDSYTIESDIIVLANATKTGYTFLGWYSENTFENRIYQIETGSHEAIELFAKFEVITYSISYTLNDGTNGLNPATYTVEDDTIVLADATKAGYDFAGWYTEAEFTNQVTEIAAGSIGDVELFAKYTITTYQITYVLNGGTNANNREEYTIETPTFILLPATKTGYEFGGWYSENTFENSITQIQLGTTGDITLYAKWNKISYTITYNTNGGTDGGNPATYTIEDADINLADGVKAHYDFLGWYTEAEFTNKVTKISQGSYGNVVLYAKYTPTVYHITYVLNGGENDANNITEFTVETDTTLLLDATKTGYAFQGWYTEAEFANKLLVINSDVTSDITLYAKFSAVTYTITYVVNGGTDGGNPATYTIEDADINLADGVKQGYTFVGWYNDSAFTEPKVESIETGSYGNKTLYALYTPNTDTQYTVKHFIEKLDGTYEEYDTTSSTGTTDTLTNASAITIPHFTAVTPITQVNIDADGSAIVEIRYTRDSYTVTFSYRSGLPTNLEFTSVTKTVKYEVEIGQFPVELSVNKYSYEVFDSLANQVTTTTTVTGDVEYFVDYQLRVLSVAYHNVETPIANQEAEAGTSVVLATATKNGYTFGGWALTLNGAKAYDGGETITMPSEPLDLYAIWTPIVYTITYNTDGGTNGGNPATYTIEDATITLAPSVKNGYTFQGWYLGNTFTNKVTEITVGSTGNKVLYAKFEINTYTITYNVDGGTNGGNPATYTVEDAKITLADGVKQGYTFAGWYTEAEFTNQVTEIAAGSTGDVELFAKYTITTYQITYVLNGGTNADNREEYTIETPTFILLPATKTGYEFGGWYSENTFENSITQIALGSTGDVVLYAKWNKISYTITYNTNGGTDGGNPATYTIEDANINLADGVKAHYDFLGWYTEAEFTNKVTKISQGSYGNVVLYAKYTPTVYHITYVLNGGENDANNITEFTVETDTTLLLDATKTGYAFQGWYTEAEFANKLLVINSDVTSDITLYAKFSAVTYTITYVVNGGTDGGNPATYTIEDAKITLADGVKNGYTFDGWYTEAEFINKVTEVAAGSTGNKTFYAKYTAATYTITYHLDGGTNGANPATYTIATDDITLAAATKTGYTFQGWYTEAGFVNRVYQIEKGSTGNVDLYAKFEVVTYTITYVINDGTDGGNPATYTIEDATIMLADGVKNGYTFDGWYTEAEFTNKVTEIASGSTGNKTFYAKYTAATYTITYHLDGGTNGANPASYTVETNTITLAAATKTGYTFNGWYSDSGFTSQVTQIAKGSTGNKTLYAKFEVVTYTITYVLNDGTDGGNPANYTVESTTITLADGVKTGYTFDGWYTEAEFTNKVTEIASGSTGNKTFYAKYTAAIYTITYHLDGGVNGSNPSTYTIATDDITLVAATKTGYTFNGWYTEAGFVNRVYQIEKGSTGNVDLYAKFEVVTYTITYVVNDGTDGGNPANYTVESATITLADGVKTGYTFIGWYTEAEFTNQVTEIAHGSTGNKTLYAKYELTEYTISYTLNGGTNGANPITYTINDLPITLANATKDNYDFVGWYTEAEFTNKVTQITLATLGNKTLYAKFTPKTYTITYELDGGTNGANPTSYTVETNTIILVAATKTGYTFNGWYSDSGFTSQVTQIAKGSTGNKTLYAKFTATVYTITYNLDGGTNGTNPATYTIATNTITLAAATKNGYTFNGWYSDSGFTSQVTQIAKGSTGNKTLYAKFTATVYTITYELDGGTNSQNNPSTYTILSNITLEGASKDGYSFEGWFLDSNHEDPISTISGRTGNLTVYAYFLSQNPGTYTITYVLNGGTNDSSNPHTFTAETPSFTLLNPTKGNAYTFAGWFLDSSFTDRIVAVDTDEIQQNITVYAKWTALQYTILYYDGDERITTLTHNTYTVEDAFTLETYNKFNHTFQGWYTESTFVNQMTQITAGTTGTIKLYAKTQDKGFTVKFYDTDKTTLLSTQTCATYGSVTAPTYTYDNAVYVLKWVDSAGNEVDLTRIAGNLDLHAQLIVISYSATIYYVDADGYANAKTSNLAITNTTESSLTYGSNISLTRQMRVTDASAYDLFYMSPVSKFDWSLAVKSISNGAVATNEEGTMASYVTISDTTGTLSIYVYCIQPVAIITSSNQTLEFTQNLDMSTSTYQFYATVDDAFEAFASSNNKLLRLYGRTNGTLSSTVLNLESGTEIQSTTISVNGVNVTRPRLVYNMSDHILHNSYSLTSGKIILPYTRKCTDTEGYKLKSTSATSSAVTHSLLIIDSNVTLELSIEVNIGAEYVTGCTLYGRSVVVNNGTIIQNAGSTLAAYGFLKGTGNLITNNNATLIDFFKIYDWPGGANGLGFYNKNIFPFESYSFHNVSCKTRIYSGATYKAWNQLYMAEDFVAEYIVLVGNGGLFSLTNGYVDKSVEDTTTASHINDTYVVINKKNCFTNVSNQVIDVRDVLEIHGDFSDNSVSIKIVLKKSGFVLANETVSTSTSMALPIGFMKLRIASGAGTLSNNSYKFLPGSSLVIENGASLTVAAGVQMIFYDEYPDDYQYTNGSTVQSGSTNPYSYQKVHAAIYTSGAINDGYHPELIVNGTLDVKGNLGGKISTASTTGSVKLASTSASLPKPTAIEYSSTGSSCTSTTETVQTKIYLYGTDSFSWQNAQTKSYSSIAENDEYGFTLNTNANSYKLTYYSVSGSTQTTVNTTESSYTITEADLPTVILEGYTFVGWYLDSNYQTEALGYVITADQSLYAKMTKIIYNIEYHVVVLDDYDQTQPIVNNNTTYFTITDTVNFADASCGTLSFYGWYIDSTYAVTAPNINSSTFSKYKLIMQDNTIHLYGYLSSVQYYSIVYFDQNNQPISSIAAQSILAGQSITLEEALPSYDSTEGLDTSRYDHDEYVFSKWEILNSSLTVIGEYNAGSSYTPSSSVGVRAKFVKSKTYVRIDPGNISNASYTVTYTGGSGSSTSSFKVPVGTSLKFSVTYTESNSKSFKYTPATGNATSGSNTSYTITANYNATVDVSSEAGGGTCLLPTSLVMLYDGTTKMAKDLTMDDEIISFNHITGRFERSKISFNVIVDYHWFDVITLQFENGKTIELATGHGFFNMTNNRYEIYYANEFYEHIGEIFATVDYVDGNFIIVPSKLVYVNVEQRYTQKVSPVSEYNINCVADGVLTIPDDIEGMFDAFTFNSDLTIDVELFQEDVMTYGLITFDEVKDSVPEYLFDVVNFQYFKIFISKGYLTVDKINHWIEAYLPYIIEQHNLDFDYDNRVILTKEMLGIA